LDLLAVWHNDSPEDSYVVVTNRSQAVLLFDVDAALSLSKLNPCRSNFGERSSVHVVLSLLTDVQL
jgi:hypothetical protein